MAQFEEERLPHTEEQESFSALVASGIRIPPQPGILIELRELLSSADYTVGSVSKVINQDPGLVSMLFKVSRSPVFSRGRKFDKLADVLQVIGIKQTFNLVQAVALSTAIGGEKREAFARFWTRAGEVAELAALIASDVVSVCNVFPDQAYMAGIFHLCGVPVLMMRFPEYCKVFDLGNASRWPNLAEEDARFNVDHCSIGYLVACHWGLPDFVCAAVRYQDEIPPQESGASVSLVCIVQLATHAYLRLAREPNPVWKSIGPGVLDELGLTANGLDDYLDDLFCRFHGRDL